MSGTVEQYDCEYFVCLFVCIEREEAESEHAHRDAIAHRLREDVVRML